LTTSITGRNIWLFSWVCRKRRALLQADGQDHVDGDGPALAGFVQAVTVKFAVYPNGSVGAFSVMGQVPDQRISDAIRNAVTNCSWRPGADAQGRPVAIYVIMPVKMQ
jgi:hypothetical protein